jgi:hypothetical protein
MTTRTLRDRLILSTQKAGRNAVRDKKARQYRFNMEFRLKPDRHADLIGVLLTLTRRDLRDISTALEISINKLIGVQRNQDYLNKDEVRRLVDLLFIICEN